MILVGGDVHRLQYPAQGPVDVLLQDSLQNKAASEKTLSVRLKVRGVFYQRLVLQGHCILNSATIIYGSLNSQSDFIPRNVSLTLQKRAQDHRGCHRRNAGL